MGIVSIPEPDVEAEDMEHAVTTQLAIVNGEEPPPSKPYAPELENHNRVKGPVLFCSLEQKEAYKTAKREDKARVYAIFLKAFLEVIGDQEVSDEAVAA